MEQIQLIQRSQDHVEVRYAREQPLSPAEERGSGDRIYQALGYPFRLTFTRQDTAARQPNGKYETFFADIPGSTGSAGGTLPGPPLRSWRAPARFTRLCATRLTVARRPCKSVEVHSSAPLDDGKDRIAESGVGRITEIKHAGATQH